MLDSQNIWSSPQSGAMAPQLVQNLDLSTRQARLKRLREYHGYKTQTAFAEWLGISLSRWNNFEKAGLSVSKEIEDLLVAVTPGLSVDWLRAGDRRFLSKELDRRLYDPDPTPRAP